MKRLFTFLAVCLKWLVLAAVFVEVLSLAVISTTNYLLYENVREGPKAVYDPYCLFLQSDGVWPTMNIKQATDARDSRTIWLFGGSTMRAADAPFDQSVPSLLAAALNAPGERRAFNLFNFGINGYNSLLEVNYLQKQLIEFPVRPNLVVFYDGINDANYFAIQKTPYAHEARERAEAAIEGYYKSGLGLFKPLMAAWVSSFTRELYNKLTYAATPLDPDSPLLAEFVADCVRRYDYINAVLPCQGARFLLFLQPSYWAEDCPNLPPGLRERERSILGAKVFPYVRENTRLVYAALRRALKDKPYFVDIADCLCSRTEEAYQRDGAHNLDYGRALVAQAMLPAIHQRLAEIDRASNYGGTP